MRKPKTTADLIRERADSNGKATDNGRAKKPAKAEPAPWPDPLPLGSVPAVALFPVDVFPPALRQLVTEVAFAVNCPADYAGVPLLAFAGGAIANARHLAITSTHRQPPCLYATYIGRP